MKNKAFTLIELLVVIVIIGLLATISAATFGKYFGKARDAVRTASVSQLTQIMKVDGADKISNDRYIYDLAGFQELVDDNDYRIPKADNDICYFIGMGDGASVVGDDNQFVIMVLGEETSTESQSEFGAILNGTSIVTEYAQTYINTFSEQDLWDEFSCPLGVIGGGTFSNLEAQLRQDSVLGANSYYFGINGAGEFVDLP